MLSDNFLMSAERSHVPKSRAKNNGEKLSFFAKKVGSDYLINNRHLDCQYKIGFEALATEAGVASALPNNPNYPKLWTVYEQIRTQFKKL